MLILFADQPEILEKEADEEVRKELEQEKEQQTPLEKGDVKSA